MIAHMISLTFLAISINNHEPGQYCISDEIKYPEKIIYDIDKTNDELAASTKREDRNREYLIKTNEDLYILAKKADNQIMAVEPCCDLANVAIFEKEFPPLKIFDYLSVRKNCANKQCLDMSDIKGFIREKVKYAREIDANYFKTKMGLELGVNPAAAIKIYGEPDSKTIISKNPQIIRYKWSRYGTLDYDVTDKRVAKEKVCDKLELGADYIIDFIKVNGKERAILIYVNHHMP